MIQLRKTRFWSSGMERSARVQSSIPGRMTLHQTMTLVSVTAAGAMTASEASTAARAASSLEEAQTLEARWSPTSQARRHRSAPSTAGNSAMASSVFRPLLVHRQISSHLLRSLLHPPTPETAAEAFPRCPQTLAPQLLQARSAFHQLPRSSATVDSMEESA
jgi:hypothetical protein